MISHSGLLLSEIIIAIFYSGFYISLIYFRGFHIHTGPDLIVMLCGLLISMLLVSLAYPAFRGPLFSFFIGILSPYVVIIVSAGLSRRVILTLVIGLFISGGFAFSTFLCSYMSYKQSFDDCDFEISDNHIIARMSYMWLSGLVVSLLFLVVIKK